MNSILKGILVCIIALVVQAVVSSQSMLVAGILMIIMLVSGIILIIIKKYRPIGIGLLSCFVINIIWLITVYNDFGR